MIEKIEKPWLMKSEDVLKDLDSNINGLTHFEAKQRLQRYGPNEIEEKKKISSWVIFLNQFKNILIVILLIATAISVLLGEILDATVIFAIIVLNALLGFYQERKAERALEALKKLAAPKAEVIREGETRIIDAREVVPGDIILLKVGDKVPADARIIEQMNLKMDESALTGESTPVEKFTSQIKGEVPVADRKNMVFSGTTCVYGHCKAVVTATAMNTEFGKIAKMLTVVEEPTPLQKRLSVLGKQLSILIVIICAIVFSLGFLRGGAILEMFMTAVALAVAAIPEGLPAVVTITLAIGLQRMADRNSIVRRLAAVETLGCTTVICSDKTGTLTVNEMTVRKIYLDGNIIDVSGEGYDMEGEFFLDDKKIEPDESLQLLLGIGLLCNDAVIDKEILGDPTEIALLISAKKAGLEDLRKRYKRVAEIPFTPERKLMSVACDVDGRRIVYTKGAVEEVLKRCSSIYTKGSVRGLSEEDRRKILTVNHDFASSGLRVLAFACKKISSKEKLSESDLMFVGLQGMLDPPRPEVKDAIDKCKKAGIKSIMITGDHKDTAIAIARELNLIDENEKGKVLTGSELDEIDDDEFKKIVEDVVIYARVSPEHKVRICDALKENGHVVAMTGDGINDAPALKKADIGVAMGITGTDVTKEASDMILTDDNFSTIVSAIEEGRGIYDNIKKFVLYLLSCNVGEVAVIFTSILLALPLPLLPLQILWMNLVTDGLPALALGVEPKEPNVMKRKPRDPKEMILRKKGISLIVLVMIVICIGTVGLFYYELPQGLEKARTIAFTTLIMFQLFAAINFRSAIPLTKIGFFSNKKLLAAVASSFALQVIIIYVPFLNTMFKTVPLDLIDWIKVISVSFSIFIILEIKKVINEKSK